MEGARLTPAVGLTQEQIHAQPGRLGRPEQRPVDINSTSDANKSPTGAEPTARLPGGLRLQPALPLAYHARRLGPTVHPRPTIGTLLGAAVWPIGNPMATTAPPTPNAVSKHMLESHRATPITRQLTSTDSPSKNNMALRIRPSHTKHQGQAKPLQYSGSCRRGARAVTRSWGQIFSLG